MSQSLVPTVYVPAASSATASVALELVEDSTNEQGTGSDIGIREAKEAGEVFDQTEDAWVGMQELDVMYESANIKWKGSGEEDSQPAANGSISFEDEEDEEGLDAEIRSVFRLPPAVVPSSAGEHSRVDTQVQPEAMA